MFAFVAFINKIIQAFACKFSEVANNSQTHTKSGKLFNLFELTLQKNQSMVFVNFERFKALISVVDVAHRDYWGAVQHLC